MTLRLVLFARFPVAGACKTRLIPRLGAQGAAQVHRQLTERTLGVLMAAGPPVELHYTGGEEADFRTWLGDGFTLVPQVEGGLSEKLVAAIDPTPVIFFGADTPDLATNHVHAALDALSTHDCVVGPADDGGYYLIGMARRLDYLLTDMPWSTDAVLPETLARLNEAGNCVHLLEMQGDCDRPTDLDRWPWLHPLST